MKEKAAVVGRHVYGFGGGAVAQIAFANGLADLGYDVTVFSPVQIDPQVARHLGQNGIGIAQQYLGCAKYADILVNVDHFTYEPPLAGMNLAHIFHPHKSNVPNDEVRKAYSFSSNSKFTQKWVKEDWDIYAPALYVPISPHFYQSVKSPMILHVSRFSRPTDLADKGHMSMISAFRTVYEAGATDWELVMAGSIEDSNYLAQLEAMARGYPIRFVANPPDHILRKYYAQAAIYWHATGISMPGIHGAQEHLGLTTIEAMASGAVPIVFGSGGQPEIVTHGESGLLCVNGYSIAAVTVDLISNLSAWSKLSTGALRASKPWTDWNMWLTRLAAWLMGNEIPEMSLPVEAKSGFDRSDVAIVIPTKNNPGYLHNCLNSIRKTEPGVSVIVVNGGDEITDELGDNVQVISAGEVNYSEANIIGGAATSKKVLVACNDDIVFIDPGWLETMLNVMGAESGGVGVVGAKLLYPTGKLQHAGGAIDWNRPEIGYHRFYGEDDFPGANQRRIVPFVTGALMMVRRECWEWPEWEGWGYEDTNLCLSAKLNGWDVVYEPAARAVHMESISRKKMDYNAALTEANRDAFSEKWYKRWPHMYALYNNTDAFSLKTTE